MKRTLCTVLTALMLATALPAIGATTEAGSTSAATTGTTTGATVGTTAGTTGGLAAGAIGTTAVVTTAAIAGVATLAVVAASDSRSEEHTSELQSRENLVCRLLLEQKRTTCSASRRW